MKERETAVILGIGRRAHHGVHLLHRENSNPTCFRRLEEVNYVGGDLVVLDSHVEETGSRGILDGCNKLLLLGLDQSHHRTKYRTRIV